MSAVWQEIVGVLVDDFGDLADVGQMTRIIVRLLIAALLGGLLGLERERAGKAAGLRTHMLVTLGAALFVLIPQQAGMAISDLSRAIQGIVTGIGFIGAGTILKLGEERRIKGLTTAASIWLSAAVGMAVGIGRLGSAIVGTILALVVLSALVRIERRLSQGGEDLLDR
jgi:putative Mg2+ transporter-C (MgtC) family protein